MKAQKFRTHTCGELTAKDGGKTVKLAGWVDVVRDHGGVLFVDLRDGHGITQLVSAGENASFDKLQKESVICITGEVVPRAPETINKKLATGEIEIRVTSLEVLGAVYRPLPFEISESKNVKEETRLKYRFLDLRNGSVRKNILLRSEVISFLRREMERLGFVEFQTPILTSSSPEGARDYLVPSRKYKGRFYALPQAPQLFKQLLMVSGVDKYFQIAPCFRDEDARADRSPGEFYQLDFEMAFASEADVFAVAEDVLYNTFKRFSNYRIDRPPFKRIPYKESMLRYGTDKPDLRNPLEILDATDFFKKCDFAPFKRGFVRAITVTGGAGESKKFFEDMLTYATSIGMAGLGYIKCGDDGMLTGPIVKFIPETLVPEFLSVTKLSRNGVTFFIAANCSEVNKFAGQIRNELAVRLNIVEKDAFRFCFVVDFPMFETDETTGKLVFSHNPFSMPQGGMDALEKTPPLDILAHQYDIVVNGVELSSGAVRNHNPEIMKKVFELAGYGTDELELRFKALYNSFHYGAPPHAGMAPGIDRIVMLLAGEDSIREVIAFPMTAGAEDLLMGAPGEVSELQLREVHIKLRS